MCDIIRLQSYRERGMIMPKKMMVIMLLSVLLACAGCNANKTASDNGAKVQNNAQNELVVGMELAYPPFEMTDANGSSSGISVDLAKELGQYLGRPVRIENMSYSGLIPALTSGKIDMIISSMTITEEREKTVSFSQPYCRSYLSLLVNKNSPVEKFEDLNNTGRKVAVKRGTTGHIYATEHLPKAQILVFDKEDACVLEVVQGKADAFIYDQMTIYKNWQNNLTTTRAILEPFQSDFEYWGIAVRKDDKELLNQTNEFLTEFKNNGGFDKLGNQYLSDIKQKFAELNIPFFF